MPEKLADTKDRHKCDGDTEHGAYGPAVDHCFEEENGELWISNEEYASRVNYCPYCGYESRNKEGRKDDPDDEVKKLRVLIVDSIRSYFRLRAVQKSSGRKT